MLGASTACGSEGEGPGDGETMMRAPVEPPEATCTSDVPDLALTGAAIVGDGTPESCTEAALDGLLADGGVSAIAFACGTSPHTIAVTTEKRIDRDLAIDGGGLVTLDGGKQTRILSLRSSFERDTPHLQIARLRFVNGFTGDQPGGEVTSGGAAILRVGGRLTVTGSTFEDNVGPERGQDVAGGAIYSLGVGETVIVGSTFTGNRCSSGGAIGVLHASLRIVNTTVTDNHATGEGGNPGNGGNGGGVYADGVSQDAVLCGVTIADNTANARGGGLFRVSNDGVGGMTIDRSEIRDNRIGDSQASQAGGLYLQGLQTKITNTTIAGNEANQAGGMFVWTNPGAQTLDMTNVTVADNRAHGGLGAGLTIHDQIGGRLHHVTIVRNGNDGETSFASAIAGGAGLTITNSIVADNHKTFTWENTSCNRTLAGTGNFQWPAQNTGGQPERPCAEVEFVDPELGDLGDHGGPTRTVAARSDSPVHAAVTDCPATDQRGMPRSTPCSAGAIEGEGE